MTPSERENGSPGETTERLEREVALRSSRAPPSSNLPNNAASSSPTLVKSNKSLSSSESRLSLTVGSSSWPKSMSSSNLHSQSHEPSFIGSQRPPSTDLVNDSDETYRQIIVRSFAPRVAVFASSDTEEFVRDKGFKDGLHSLLRPYGERLYGKVIIRDSMGGSRGWDNFGIRLMDSQALHEDKTYRAGGFIAGQDADDPVNNSQRVSEQSRSSYNDETGTLMDRVLDSYLRTTSATLGAQEKDHLDFESTPYEPQVGSSSLYPIYLRKLLSSASIVPYETFSHPVTCLIAVSSSHPAPIEALRQLYSDTGHEGKKIPAWMGTEYLRYYVLIHDEENDEITKSTALFDLMKRHFGLHCHLLRLRRSQSVLSDDDSTRVPSCEWLSPEEEIGKLWLRDYTDDVELSEKFVHESDATAIKSFIREMVTQSIVPFMESRVVTWNDQVASRRRGFSGRFMSLSKRWTGFGTNKSTTPGLAGVSNPSGSNYDDQQGFYPPDTPESTMRQLGDYAFMLRDWKLAYSTYEFLRADFGHDKAWTYHAAANEMAAITSLLTPHAFNSRPRSESLDQMLDTASYSYLTRCSMPFNVVRCLTIAFELLKARGPNAAGDAARWGARMLEIGVLTPSAQALATERIAECYRSRTRAHLADAGTSKRQAALWSLLASESWLRLDKPDQARVRLREASALYGLETHDTAGLPFPSMQGLWQRLELALSDPVGDYYATLIDTRVAQDDIELNTIGKRKQLSVSTHSSIRDTESFTTEGAGYIHPASYDDPQLQNDGFE